MGRRRGGFLCCFYRPPAVPPAYHPPDSCASAIDYNGGKQHQTRGIEVQQQQQQQFQKHVEQMDARLESLKGDLAREMGYPLAVRLIHEVSAVFDPNIEKMSLRKHPNPWGWLHHNHDFKRALSELGDSISDDVKSVDAISNKAAQIMSHSNRKFIKSYPEVLYKDLKDFRGKGYMEALSATDADLRSFLELSGFFATAFIAKPRLLQITTFMLQRVRDELAIYWHTWEKLPFSWDERWHEAESWFQAAVDCFKDHSDGSSATALPDTIIALAREFDSIEEAARHIYGVNRLKEVGSFEQILRQFEEMKESGLLTLEVQKQNALCFAFLEYSPEIKDRYMAIIEKKHVVEEERKLSIVNSFSRLTNPDDNTYGLYGGSNTRLGSSSRVKTKYQALH